VDDKWVKAIQDAADTMSFGGMRGFGDLLAPTWYGVSWSCLPRYGFATVYMVCWLSAPTKKNNTHTHTHTHMHTHPGQGQLIQCWPVAFIQAASCVIV